jgi:type I restriction enzyme S subunit
MEKIRKFKLPLVSIEEQKKMVNTLKQFDSMCHDIADGLPAEIEARQKQYEYYRDKLLSF